MEDDKTVLILWKYILKNEGNCAKIYTISKKTPGGQIYAGIKADQGRQGKRDI